MKKEYENAAVKKIVMTDVISTSTATESGDSQGPDNEGHI